MSAETWEVERAHAWAKLYGYVRWFHPSDEASALDMDAWACYGAAAIEDAADPEALREVLAELVAPVAPTAQIWLSDQGAPEPVALLETDDWTAWQHHGWGHNTSNVYVSARAGRTASRAMTGDLYATVTQEVDATALRGRRIRFSSDAKVGAPGSKWTLWVRVNRSDEQVDNLRSELIYSTRWTPVSVEGVVAEDAETLTVGAYLSGVGAGWLDGVSLEVETPSGWEAVKIRGREFERSRVYGWDVTGEGYDWGTRWEPSEMRRGFKIWRATKELPPAFERLPAQGDDRYSLGAGLTARVPLVLPDQRTVRGEPGTRPVSEVPAPQLPFCEADTKATRVAASLTAWNILRHFYPYSDVVAVDWDGVLNTALAGALGEGSLQPVLETLVAATNDGHGNVYAPDVQQRGMVPVAIRLVEDQLVVVTSAVEAIRPGDRLVAVDGVEAETVLAMRMARAAGSPQFKAAIVPEYLSWGPDGEAVGWSLMRGEQSFGISLTYGRERPPPLVDRPEIEQLEDGVFYVDLNTVTWETLEGRLEELAAAPGVVFDLRVYPKDGTYQLIQHLLTQTDDAEWMFIPQINQPDGEVSGWSAMGWSMEPAEPHIGGEVVFLISGRAISYAESVLGFVEGYELGELVGGPSAGANGNVNTSPLPGGWRMSWTGMKVLKHDGSQQHVIGVTPTVPVAPTLAGVGEGRDEVLERGLEVVRQRIADSSEEGR